MHFIVEFVKLELVLDEVLELLESLRDLLVIVFELFLYDAEGLLFLLLLCFFRFFEVRRDQHL